MKKCILLAIIVLLYTAVVFGQNKSIYIQLKYPTISVETKKNADGKIEVTTKDYGFSDFNLQLRDLTIIKLSDKGYNCEVLDSNSNDYIVTIHSVFSSTLDKIFSSIEVQIFKKGSSKYISRKLVKGFNLMFSESIDKLSTELASFVKEALD